MSVISYLAKSLSENHRILPTKTLTLLPLLFVQLASAWKVSKYEVIFGPYFPAFGMNTEIYNRKIRTRNNSVLDTFHIVGLENTTLKGIINIKSVKNCLVIRTGDTLETTEKYCHIEQIIFPCFSNKKEIYRVTCLKYLILI